MPISRAENFSPFPPTRWSLVARAVAFGEAASEPLGELLTIYWRPLYAFARQSGKSREDAEDAVQGFCEILVRREALRTADAHLGRLRSFLLTAFQHHLVSLHRRESRHSRGGGHFHIPWEEAAEAVEPALADGVSPDVIYERLWAKSLLDQVLLHLRAEYAARGKADLLEKIEPFIFWGGDGHSQAVVAGEMNMTLAAVQQAVKRLRLRYRELLEEEVAQTLDRTENLAEELRHLMRVLTNAV